MDLKIIFTGAILFLGLLGMAFKTTDLETNCSKMNFEQNLESGNLKVVNTGEVASGGKIVTYKEIGDERYNGETIQIEPIKPGESRKINVDSHNVRFHPDKCSSKVYTEKSDGKKLSECIDRRGGNKTAFKKCAGI